MSNPPTPYARIFDFEAFSANNPATQQPGVQFEGEFDAIKITLDGLISRLSEIQRSDGKIDVSAFDNTTLLDDVTDAAYSNVYAQIYPLVSEALNYRNQASGFATNSANSASASALSAAAALQHKNAAQAAINTVNGYVQQVAQTLGSINVSVSNAQSAAAQSEQSKQAALEAKQNAEETLGSVQFLQQSLANQYDNMLDADMNLGDVSNKAHALTNLGLDGGSESERSIYNRFKTLYHMYENHNNGTMIGNSQTLYPSADSLLFNIFGLSFNQETGTFINGPSQKGYQFARNYLGQGEEEDNSSYKNRDQRIEILKKRMSVLSSVFRTSLLETHSTFGWGGDNRIITLQDFADDWSGIFSYHVNLWTSSGINLAVQNQLNVRFNVPSDGKKYGIQYGNWVAIDENPSGIAEYDNYKVYNAGEQVFFNGSFYYFNAFIGAAGYGPDTHPAAWTMIGGGGGASLPIAISDVTGLQTELDGKALSSHGHGISDVADLQTALDGKASSVHSHGISDVTGLQTALDGKSSSSHTHAISAVTGLQTALDGKAGTVHTHEISAVSGLQTALDGKASTSHTQAISTITNLQSTLDGKASSVHTHAIADVTNLQTTLDGKASSSHTHTIANITNLQSSLDAKASTSALTSGLAGKANTSHTHAITDITNLQTTLNGKADSSHVHVISEVTGLQTSLSSKVPNEMACSTTFDKDVTVTAPSGITVLAYDGGDDGTVTVTGAVGNRFCFFQAATATNRIRFNSVMNVEDKFFTKGPKSYVEAIVTTEGVVVHGDLAFPQNGYLISASCDETTAYDQLGVPFTGNFLSTNVYANGNGGTYTNSGVNQNGCWYPYGFCTITEYVANQSVFSWSGLGQSGSFIYHKDFANVKADGNGGTFLEMTTTWDAAIDTLIYEGPLEFGSSVKYDGNESYYIFHQAYGFPLPQGSGNLYVNFAMTSELLLAGTYTEDRFADGLGGAYTANLFNNWYPNGTFLGNSGGYDVYSDGAGGYYY